MAKVALTLGSSRNMGPWPAVGLDVVALRVGGRRPLPFPQFVLKIHSRCNLACDYCYMYELADKSWVEQPKTMSRETFSATCRMILEHVQRLGIRRIDIALHGGEPLMVGHADFAWFVEHAHTVLDSDTDVRIAMQTNGVLLDSEFLDICDRWNVAISVSIDGDRSGHDRHRRYRRGRGSYDDVVAGLGRLTAPRYRHLFAGLLCVIDVANDPIATYRELCRFDPPGLDFLLPHGNWTAPPPNKSDASDSTPYGDWLIPIFDRWYGATTLEPPVRLFTELLDLLLGKPSRSEAIGLSPVQFVTIETDGTLEQVDALKSAYAGATKLNAVGEVGNPLDAAMWDPSVVARQIGIEALSETCRACPIHMVCGGGHYVHRYRADSGFRNPSVYCADLKKLIHYASSQVRSDIAAAGR